MREARIILPQTAAAPGDARLAYETATAECCKAFGGVTVTKGDGAWVDNAGKLIAEPVYILDIACEATARNVKVLRQIADQAGQIAAQEAIYIRYPSGNVELRPTGYLWKPAAGRAA